jgi:hypothetical protein
VTAAVAFELFLSTFGTVKSIPFAGQQQEWPTAKGGLDRSNAARAWHR